MLTAPSVPRACFLTAALRRLSYANVEIEFGFDSKVFSTPLEEMMRNMLARLDNGGNDLRRACGEIATSPGTLG